jgi:heptosyltransferase-2
MKYVFKKSFYIALISVFDALGYIISFPFRLIRKSIPPAPRNILVVRLDHIGDFVCTSPLFANLKARFPEAGITVLVNSASKELAYANPHIDKVITYSPSYLARAENGSTLKGLMRVIKDVRNIGFDLGIDPRGDLMSILIMWLGGVKYRVGYGITGGGFLLHKEGKYDRSKHIIDRNLELLRLIDVPVVDRMPTVVYCEKDAEAVEQILDRVKRGNKGKEGDIREWKWVVLHPYAGAKSKEWSRDNFQKIINLLNDNGYTVLLVGSRGDLGIFDKVADLRGKISLPQLACLIQKSGLFIGLDSGPANIAAALGVPSVIICSGTNIPELWIPRDSNVKLVYKDVDCKPCGLRRCNINRHKCMESVDIDDVISVITGVQEPA